MVDANVAAAIAQWRLLLLFNCISALAFSCYTIAVGEYILVKVADNDIIWAAEIATRVFFLARRMQCG